MWIAIAAVIVVFTIPVVALFLYVASANRLAALDARGEMAFADIEPQPLRRADLIPGLVEWSFNLAIGKLSATLRPYPARLMARPANSRERRAYDLGVEPAALKDPFAFRFAPAGN